MKLIELPEPRSPREGKKIDSDRYCQYHRMAGHTIQDCFIFKETLGDLQSIDLHLQLQSIIIPSRIRKAEREPGSAQPGRRHSPSPVSASDLGVGQSACRRYAFFQIRIYIYMQGNYT